MTRTFAPCLILLMISCGDDAKKDPAPQAVCEAATPVSCEDEAILELNLQDTVAPGLITNTASGEGWVSVIDATAGGFGADPPHAHVYARFTDDGLTKVTLDDELALGSMDWDIAFRRSVIRLNSADSGPSCVRAGLVTGAQYDAVSDVQAVQYRADEWLGGSCEFIEDVSGLPGSPATALAGFWTYTGCVKMTGDVYQVQLRDGRVLKLIVDAFYLPNVQAECQTDDTTRSSPTGSGTIRLRWAFLGE